MRVLIAEDEYTTRLKVRVCLEKAGYRVVDFADGLQAKNALKGNRGPEIAILDRVMPKMSGLDLCRWIKSLERDSPVYVIMLTALDSKEDMLAGFAAGADDYITKPFDEEELLARVRAAERVVRTQESLSRSVVELGQAINLIEDLKSEAYVCTTCSKIAGDDGVWCSFEDFIADDLGDVRLQKVTCPECRQIDSVSEKTLTAISRHA